MTDVFTSTGDLTPEEQARREAHARVAMEQSGERMETYVEPDFFGEDDIYTVPLPGSQSQYVVIKALNEGERRKYLDRTNRDVKMDRTGNATLRTTPGSDRYELLKIAIVDYNLKVGDGYKNLANGGNGLLEKFLTQSRPTVIDEIVREVNKRNPWLLAEMSVEDIEREISNLQEMLEEKKKQEALDAQF